MSGLWRTALCVAALVLAAATPALAEEGASDFWTYWNQFWRIANFLILAFLIVKLGKKPLLDFIAGQRKVWEVKFDVMEKKKAEAELEVRQIKKKIAHLADEIKALEENLTAVAEKERTRTLEEAEFESKAIMERAQVLSHRAVEVARKRLAAEMLAEAESMAIQQLTAAIDASDQDRLFNEFLREARARA